MLFLAADSNPCISTLLGAHFFLARDLFNHERAARICNSNWHAANHLCRSSFLFEWPPPACLCSWPAALPTPQRELLFLHTGHQSFFTPRLAGTFPADKKAPRSGFPAAAGRLCCFLRRLHTGQPAYFFAARAAKFTAASSSLMRCEMRHISRRKAQVACALRLHAAPPRLSRPSG